MIKGNALQILRERYNEIEEDITFREFVEQQADEDPNFYKRLFKGNPNNNSKTLTEKQIQAYKDFLDSI